MFSKRRNDRRKNKGNRQSQSAYQSLEPRQLLAGVFHDTATGDLTIIGDGNNNVATVTEVGSIIRTDVEGTIRDFNLADVTKLIFVGFGGDDNYTNSTSLVAQMYGHAGNDTLRGGSNDDVVVGGIGDDILHGNGGNDRIVGAAGNDTMFGGDGEDSMFGSTGTNEIRGGADNDLIFGGDQVDTIHGDAGIDQIFGLAGDDFLFSGTGGTPFATGLGQADLILGHGGNDTFTGGGGLDVFWGGDGNDVMTGGSGENRMHGQNGNDTMTGGPLADLIRGIADNDVMFGLGGADTIDGGSGDDIANGGAGNDSINMNAGSNDIVEFASDYDGATVSATGNGANVTVTSTADGTDTITLTEQLEFSDRQITSDQATMSQVEAISLQLLNEFRQNNNRESLSTPRDLHEYASNWSNEMITRGLVHSSNTDQLGLLGNGRTTVGENIVWISDIGQSAEEVAAAMHDLWINSTSHRTNMLNSSFTEVGVGIVRGGGRWYGTHIFTG